MAVEESALIVPVPETETAVGACRAELDRTAGWGVPAHVTVLYPFLSPDQIGPTELQRLTDVVRSVPRFGVTFSQVQWFGGEVAWLDPEPGDGFQALTHAACAAFPGCLPYGGEFDGVVPHLTLAAHGEPDRMHAAVLRATVQLPISAAIRSVHLFKGTDAPGAWHSIAELPLGDM
jgi:2'-5' RNA ligase